MINALRRRGVTGISSIIFSLLICILYAISDEIHQVFVPGREAQVKDVIIDSGGAAVGIGVYLIINRKKNNTKVKNLLDAR